MNDRDITAAALRLTALAKEFGTEVERVAAEMAQARAERIAASREFCRCEACQGLGFVKVMANPPTERRGAQGDRRCVQVRTDHVRRGNNPYGRRKTDSIKYMALPLA